MNYQQTLEWMYEQLPMFQKIGVAAFEKDLTKITAFSEYLNYPENNFKSVHIGGTNGKGSTSSLIASVMKDAGYKVGLYTSPHLVDFRERIRINGEEIPKQFVVEFIEKHRVFIENKKLSFFEMTVGMAFQYFSDEKVDLAVIEVGLGGKLDATNIIQPLVSVITNIGWDHMNILGNSLQEIAAEKAGIIKNHTPIIIGEFMPETKSVFDAEAQVNNAPIFYASLDAGLPEITSDLKGAYQKMNKKTALKTLEVLQKYFQINPFHIESGFLSVGKNTGLKGRWTVLGRNPLIVADTAHNKDGLELVLKQILDQVFKQLHFVLGVVNDKDIDSILALMPKDAIYYLAKPNVVRGLDARVLKSKMDLFGLQSKVFESIPLALEFAKYEAKSDDMIYVGGSTFVVAEVV